MVHEALMLQAYILNMMEHGGKTVLKTEKSHNGKNEQAATVKRIIYLSQILSQPKYN
jgi:hypothetical protein